MDSENSFRQSQDRGSGGSRSWQSLDRGSGGSRSWQSLDRGSGGSRPCQSRDRGSVENSFRQSRGRESDENSFCMNQSKESRRSSGNTGVGFSHAQPRGPRVWLRAAGVAACVAGVLCLGACSGKSGRRDDSIDELRQIREEAEATAETNSPLEVTQRKVLNTYENLYSQNEDLIGWLIIDGTQIDDPVMWTPDDPEYYRDRGFDRQESGNGLLYMDGESNISAYGGNLIIYGQDGESDSPFSDLQNYEEMSFWEKYGTIRFDTLYESRTYEIAAVAWADDVGSVPFEFISPDEEAANLAIGRMQEAALYDTGVDLSYGDDFLTLAGWNGSEDGESLVIMARRIQ
ncbi:MAG: class B sortase [Clostridiales bacterium]|nr:class B sortase [Clostridiales bacterium]